MIGIDQDRCQINSKWSSSCLISKILQRTRFGPIQAAFQTKTKFCKLYWRRLLTTQLLHLFYKSKITGKRVLARVFACTVMSELARRIKRKLWRGAVQCWRNHSCSIRGKMFMDERCKKCWRENTAGTTDKLPKTPRRSSPFGRRLNNTSQKVIDLFTTRRKSDRRPHGQNTEGTSRTTTKSESAGLGDATQRGNPGVKLPPSFVVGQTTEGKNDDSSLK